MKVERYFSCACRSDVLRVARVDMEKGEKEFEVSIFRQRPPLSWKERIRWIWKIITTGDLWGDDIILTPRQMAELKGFIDDALM